MQSRMEQNTIARIQKILIGNGSHHLFHLLIPSILPDSQKIRPHDRQQTFFSNRFIRYEPDSQPGNFFNLVHSGMFEIFGQLFAEQLFYRLITANHDRQTAERVEKPITCIHLPPQGDPLTIDSDLHLLGPSA